MNTEAMRELADDLDSLEAAGCIREAADRIDALELAADESTAWHCAVARTLERDEARDRIDTLEGALREQQREHLYVEDCWYSCPKAEDGCCDERQGDECNCGADAANAKIDAVLASASLNTGEPTPAVPGVANEGDA